MWSSCQCVSQTSSTPGPSRSAFSAARFDPGSTSLAVTVQYSNDNGATWTYVPGSGSCGAPVQYDYCVTHVRWELSGTMPADQSFIVSFAGRVK